MAKSFDELTLADNFMFNKVMSKPEACKPMLEILLGIKVGTLNYPEMEKTLAVSHSAHGVRLDVHASDTNRDYDIELQVANKGDMAKRARYYQDVLDVDFLEKGNGYSTLKENIVIFLCMFDPFKKKLPVYTFENICREKKSLKLGDKTLKVYYNIPKRDKLKNRDAAAFLEYIKTSNATDEYTRKLSEFVQEVKMTAREWKEYMDLQDIKKTEREEGFSAGARKKAIETARNLLALGLGTLEQIARATGLSLAEIQRLEYNT